MYEKLKVKAEVRKFLFFTVLFMSCDFPLFFFCFFTSPFIVVIIIICSLPFSLLFSPSRYVLLYVLFLAFHSLLYVSSL